MPQLRTRLLVMAATLVSGMLAGGIIDRVIVGGPAWHELGAEAWVEYSRRAHLWTRLVAYPFEGIGATLLIVAAALSNYFDRSARREVALAPLRCGRAFHCRIAAHGQGGTNHAEPSHTAIRFRQSSRV